MIKVSRIQAGYYSVSDGRKIKKNGRGWYVISESGSHDFGPVTTLNAAKQYVETGTSPIGQHNLSSSHGRRQSKKEFNAYLAAEAKNGNPFPAILWMIVVFTLCMFFVAIDYDLL
ncbi:hypothetical protein L4C36_14585 [Photobacterium japonica]|uniref:hypothetical protein n=1 Tax=Photobacterium japonica TaxID=2910235 RepID=UPI003D12DD4A